MEWEIIVACGLSGAGVAAVILSLARKTLERAIGLRFEHLEEKNKLNLQEAIRRQAFIYDRQFESVKEALSEVYRSRNTVRKLLSYLPDNPDGLRSFRRHGRFQSQVVHLRQNLEKIYQLLYEDHSMMTEDFFLNLHNFKNLIESTLFTLNHIGSKPDVSVNEMKTLKHTMRGSLADIEETRDHLLYVFQSKFLAEAQEEK